MTGKDRIEWARTTSAVRSMTMQDMIDAIFTLRDALTAAEEERDRAWESANDALYFADNSDYRSALWEVCKTLKPNIEPGKRHSEELHTTETEGE